jgi:hypothetical protein
MSAKDQTNRTKQPMAPTVTKTLDHTNHGSRPKMRMLQFYLGQYTDRKFA